VSYTPGPWYFALHADGAKFVETPPDTNGTPTDICRVFATENDARLIAAAPDMLGALKVLVDAWGDSDAEVARSAIHQAEDAIAKAEGESE
jgi:hypothetical protein